MTSMTKLGLQGFAFGVALTSGGCMPQNQDQIDQLRAELTALKTEVATLKGTTPATPAADATLGVAPGTAAASEHPGATGSSPSAAASAADFDWDAAVAKHDKEERDAAWSRLREPDLFTAAKAHIKTYGASLNGVRCKATSCLITVNVPKKPKTEYAVMANPWAGTDMFAHSKGIYSGRTLWSYLLTRHEKDTKEAAEERVDPADLAKQSPELVHAAVLVGPSTPADIKAETKPAESKPGAGMPAETKPAPSAAKAKPVDAKPSAVETAAEPATVPAAEPGTTPAGDVHKPTEASKPVAVKPVSAKPATKATVETKPAAPVSEAAAVKATDAKPAAKTAPAKPAADTKVAANLKVPAETKVAVKPAEAKPAAAAPAAESKPAAAAATPAAGPAK